MRRFQVASFALFALSIACQRSEQAALRPVGPLAALAVTRPQSLSRCDVSDRQYVAPFWHAPYRECRDTAGGKSEVMELDADTLLTELSTLWDVPANQRESEFKGAVAELTSRFGPPYACSSRMFVWRGRDSVRAALLLQPNADVIGPGTLDSVSWRISRHARLGPLLDAFWCTGARAALGA